jgi:hypothetical protein
MCRIGLSVLAFVPYSLKAPNDLSGFRGFSGKSGLGVSPSGGIFQDKDVQDWVIGASLCPLFLGYCCASTGLWSGIDSAGAVFRTN